MDGGRGVSGSGQAVRSRGADLGPVQDRAKEAEVNGQVADFRHWLVAERGLAEESVRSYGIQAKKFLMDLSDPREEALTGLDAPAVINFVIKQSRADRSVWSTKAMVTALRSLLRFLHIEGRIQMPLAPVVPGVAGWRHSTLPRALPREQVQALLAAHDLGTPVGLRDHAILIMLARLALRGAEVAAVQLAHIDWRAGEVMVIGKGSRTERLPLPAEVGAAMVAYATGGRPPCNCRALFVTVRAPYRQLTPGAIRAIMGRACRKAGLPRLGAHRLRHTVATDLVRAGASLAEVGQLLRHHSQLSTVTYAKIDLDRLGVLARPWPASQS